MMHLYAQIKSEDEDFFNVLILVVMDDALVPFQMVTKKNIPRACLNPCCNG